MYQEFVGIFLWQREWFVRVIRTKIRVDNILINLYSSIVYDDLTRTFLSKCPVSRCI